VAALYLTLGSWHLKSEDVVLQRLQEVRKSRTDSEGRNVALERLLNDRDWITAAWSQISSLVVMARYDESDWARAIKEVTELSKTEASLDAVSERALDGIHRFETAQQRRGNAEGARQRICMILSYFISLGDARVIRFIGPLLEENETNMWASDYGIPSVEHSASSAIHELISKGVAVPNTPQSPFDQEGWRRWWRDNHSQFGPDLSPIPKAAPHAVSESNKRSKTDPAEGDGTRPQPTPGTSKARGR
jgi:hypothetical protein